MSDETLYVLRRPDGSVRAELFLTPALADKINATRHKKGSLDDWMPQNPAEYGLGHIDVRKIPDSMHALWLKSKKDLDKTDYGTVRV